MVKMVVLTPWHVKLMLQFQVQHEPRQKTQQELGVEFSDYRDRSPFSQISVCSAFRALTPTARFGSDYDA